MDVIEAVCDRVVIMNEGRVVADDGVEQLRSNFDTQRFQVSSPDIDERVQQAVSARFEVTDVSTVGDDTRIEVATDSDGIYELFDLLGAHDVHLDSVTTTRPDLEDVFVDLTSGGQR